MLSAEDLEAVVNKHQPDFIIPEIEAIRTEKLQEFEKQGATNFLSHVTISNN